MRALLVIIGLFTSISATAQQRDSIYISGGKLVMQDASTPAGKAYIEVDGKIFTGKLSSIKPADIKEFSIIKPVDAKKAFGASGANGAYFIKTNVGQMADLRPPADAPSDTGKVYNHSFAQVPPNGKDSVMYMIDGELATDMKLRTLDPGDVISIDVLKNGKNQDPSLNNVRGNAVVVITKPFAIKQYQQKISLFSKEYKQYLSFHHNDDSKLVYVVNGVRYQHPSNARVGKLYKMFAINVISMQLTVKYKPASGPIPSSIEIEAK
jgi:hypothetical protein